jgi:hypothetical protein
MDLVRFDAFSNHTTESILALESQCEYWPRATGRLSSLAGRWSGPNGNVAFAGTFVDDFPVEGVWTDRGGAAFDVVLREKTVLSNYFSEGESIFTSKKKKGAKDEPVTRPLPPTLTISFLTCHSPCTQGIQPYIDGRYLREQTP